MVFVDQGDNPQEVKVKAPASIRRSSKKDSTTFSLKDTVLSSEVLARLKTRAKKEIEQCGAGSHLVSPKAGSWCLLVVRSLQRLSTINRHGYY